MGSTASKDGRRAVTPARIAAYFFRLGALGFGGPVALAETMRHDLVEDRAWLSESEYETGLAIAAACPGPLAYQLGVYCGFVRFGGFGALLVGVSFALFPFALVSALAALYVTFSTSWPVRALFYGVAPVVVALVLRAAFRLGSKTLRREPAAWILASIACTITVAVQKELTAIFPAAGLLGMHLFARPREGSRLASLRARSFLLPLSSLPGLGLGPGMKLFAFFFKTGCLVFGSGLVIVPFLKTYVVDQYGWVDAQTFLDAVAIGMISPGPVVITATFVGYLVSGLPGALAATLGMFTPAVLFTVVATPLLQRHGAKPRLRGFVRGVTVSVVGVLTGTIALIAPLALTDLPTVFLAVGSFLVLTAWRPPDVALVGAGALAGLALYPWLHAI